MLFITLSYAPDRYYKVVDAFDALYPRPDGISKSAWALTCIQRMVKQVVIDAAQKRGQEETQKAVAADAAVMGNE